MTTSLVLSSIRVGRPVRGLSKTLPVSLNFLTTFPTVPKEMGVLLGWRASKSFAICRYDHPSLPLSSTNSISSSFDKLIFNLWKKHNICNITYVSRLLGHPVYIYKTLTHASKLYCNGALIQRTNPIWKSRSPNTVKTSGAFLRTGKSAY
jgi:hypothetical protein